MGRARLGACSLLAVCSVAAIVVGSRPAPAPARPSETAGGTARARTGELDRLLALRSPLYCGGRHARVVALTFDDGPGPYTRKLLALLRQWHDRATFFLVADRISDWPRLPAEEAALGAVGDHTWSHARLPLLSYRGAKWEIEAARTAIAAASHRKVVLFRPPYGLLTRKLHRLVFAKGMLEVRWSLDSHDAVSATTTEIVRTVEREIRPGAIVLMHDIHASTVAAVARILPALARRHLRSVSIPELLRVDPPTRHQLRLGPHCL